MSLLHHLSKRIETCYLARCICVPFGLVALSRNGTLATGESHHPDRQNGLKPAAALD